MVGSEFATGAFYLGPLSARQDSLVRTGQRIALFGLVAVWVVVIVAGLPTLDRVIFGGFADPTQAAVDYSTIGIGLPAINLILVWMVLTARPGPSMLRIDDKGLSFDFSSGNTVDIAWTDKRLRVTLYSMVDEEGPRSADSYRAPFLTTPQTGRIPILIPREAFLSILKAARVHQLSTRRIAIAPWNLQGLSTSAFCYRIGPGSSDVRA